MKVDCGTSYQPDQKYLRILVAKRKLAKFDGDSLSSVEKKKRCDYLWALVSNDIYETIEEKRKQLESLEDKVNALRNDEKHLDFLIAESLIDVIVETSMINMEEGEIANLRNHVRSWKQSDKASLDELDKCENDANNLKAEIKNLDDQLKILYNQPEKVKEDKEQNKDDIEKRIKETEKEQQKEIESKLDLIIQDTTLDNSLENVAEERSKLLKMIDNELNREVTELDMSEDLLGCCTEKLINKKQNVLEESQFKLRENHLEKIKIQSKKADIRKEKGDIIKKIVELEIKLVNYKTELQKLTNETKIDTLQNLMEKLA